MVSTKKFLKKILLTFAFICAIVLISYLVYFCQTKNNNNQERVKTSKVAEQNSKLNQCQSVLNLLYSIESYNLDEYTTSDFTQYHPEGRPLPTQGMHGDDYVWLIESMNEESLSNFNLTNKLEGIIYTSPENKALPKRKVEWNFVFEDGKCKLQSVLALEEEENKN